MLRSRIEKNFAFTCTLFAYWIGVTICWQTLVPLWQKDSSVTYDAVYALIVALVTCILFGVCVYKVGKAAWTTHEPARGAALVGTVAVVVGVIVSVAVGNNAIALPPQVCTQYIEAVGELQTNQLTKQDCTTRQSMPLYEKGRKNCSTYFSQTAPNTYAYGEPVCVKGFIPAPRP